MHCGIFEGGIVKASKSEGMQRQAAQDGTHLAVRLPPTHNLTHRRTPPCPLPHSKHTCNPGSAPSGCMRCACRAKSHCHSQGCHAAKPRQLLQGAAPGAAGAACVRQQRRCQRATLQPGAHAARALQTVGCRSAGPPGELQGRAGGPERNTPAWGHHCAACWHLGGHGWPCGYAGSLGEPHGCVGGSRE